MIETITDIIGVDAEAYRTASNTMVEARLDAVAGLLDEAVDHNRDGAMVAEYRVPARYNHIVVELHPRCEWSLVNGNMTHMDDLLPYRILVAGDPEQVTATTMSHYHAILMSYRGSELALDDGTVIPFQRLLDRLADGTEIWAGHSWERYDWAG